MVKLTKQKKIIIALSVILPVLIFSITMFSIWATVEVYNKKVDYGALQRKLEDYFIVPSGLEDEVKEPCRVSFPEPEEGSKHRYGKYTNLTVRYKYATGYGMELEGEDVGARISASKGDNLSSLETECYDLQTVNGIDVYYKRESSAQYGKTVESTEIIFVLDGATYLIWTVSSVDNARQKANDYARILFDKFFKVDSNSLK